MPNPMTTAELRALASRPFVDVDTAGRVLGIGHTAAYDLARRDAFPCPVIKVTHRRWIVPTAPLLRLAGLDGDAGRSDGAA
jgi:hypothetical protein